MSQKKKAKEAKTKFSYPALIKVLSITASIKYNVNAKGDA
jgi:hypothetical protein